MNWAQFRLTGGERDCAAQADSPSYTGDDIVLRVLG